ncbi:alpha/beta fold hydrolase [Streptomyces sp. BE303]|uniref:alpha/beta fold hydrolase n=1 Tax=Streptomyces sp. BE303 TaxID=3002528 RepID=UPI002E770A1F|nr:alpha/beta hydrolase [Streptomyces sp. BE303]MED7948526.1 alpha/beta hydrolase [Streptomyces sp. BE303]
MTTHAGPVVPTAVFFPRTAVGTAHALVLAPVTPGWDGGAFFTPVVRTLVGAGLRVTVADTLALWGEEVTSLAGLAARWREVLPTFGPVDVLCGNALGGAVAQALLPDIDPATAALLVSGPARSDTALAERLGAIADLAAAGRPAAALDLLSRRILPQGRTPDTGGVPAPATEPDPRTAPATETDADPATDTEAGRRLAGGLRLLRDIDLTDAVRAHPGPLLQIVGGRSQLVTRRHTAAAPHHVVHVVPRAGMRPHFDQPAEVSARVEALLREKGLR